MKHYMSLKWLQFGAIMTFAACASGSSTAGDPAGRADPFSNYYPDRASMVGGGAEFASIYSGMGLAASGPPISFVGDVAFYATRTADTALAVVGMSIPNRGLTFKHVPNGYSAGYITELSMQGSDSIHRQARDSESVQVTNFKETSRTDESVIYRRAFRVAPGSYSLTYSVADVYGQREATKHLTVSVPRMGALSISSLEPVYQSTPRVRLDSVPNYLPAPRSSYVFGVDDSASLYVEAYGPPSPLSLEMRDPTGRVVWRGTTILPQHGPGLSAGTVRLPLGHADVGVVTAVATRAGSSDSSKAPLFLGFGPDLPVLSFNEMLKYLRFFSGRDRLQALSMSTATDRGDKWAEFLRETDPVPNTPQNEALDEYFSRIRDANTEFRNDVPRGWLSDRGMVYVGLGQPSGVYEDYGYMYMTGDYTAQPGARVKIMVWTYNEYPARLIFYDPNDVGQWRLSRQSASIFQSLIGRRTNR